MSQIKDVIETLAKNWSWEAVKKNPARSLLLTKHYVAGGGIKIMVPTGPNFSREFTFRHEKKNGDLRIWTKSTSGLLQWRTCPVKGDRLVYRPFGNGTQTERLAIEEIFLDTHDVDEGEVEMFEVLYSDLVPMIPLFEAALKEADSYLRVDYAKSN